MRSMRPGRYSFPLALALATLSLTNCSSLLTEGTSGASGIAGAGIAGAVSRNAVVGAAIGIGVKSAADVGLQYARRKVHRTEQDEIASAAGVLPVGNVGTWTVSHDLPIERDERGKLFVVREIGGANLACREIVFSVETANDEKPAEPDRAFYTATVCRDGPRWKWATAEPAVERWGGLQ